MDELTLGIIYSYPFREIPTICIKDKIIQDNKKQNYLLTAGDIYYRYPGCSEKCKPAELIMLFSKQSWKKNNVVIESNIKPIFIVSGSTFYDRSIVSTFVNIGERAKIISFIPLKENKEFVQPLFNGYVDKGEVLKVIATQKSVEKSAIRLNGNIIFENKEGKKYQQEINIVGATAAVINDPIELENDLFII